MNDTKSGNRVNKNGRLNFSVSSIRDLVVLILLAASIAGYARTRASVREFLAVKERVSVLESLVLNDIADIKEQLRGMGVDLKDTREKVAKIEEAVKK